MPKILITGNGFDLNIGLPTSYNDFIKILSYISGKNKEINFHSIFSNSNDYRNILEKFSKFEFDNERIAQLKNQLDHNLWFTFFSKEYEIDTWIDFENRIEYVLNKLFTSLEYLQKNVFSKGSIKSKTLIYNSDTFNNDYELIHVLANFSIVSFNVNYQITLNDDFLKRRYNFYTGIDISKITKLLISELQKFKSIFNQYFEIFIFPLYENFKIELDKDYYNNIDYHYTFNYTPTFDKLFKLSKQTRFLHGKINSVNNRIVLGINEIPSNTTDKRFFLPFTKYYQKLNNETDYIFLEELKMDRKADFMFLFFGHSLDRSDRDYVNEVFDFVNNLNGVFKKIIIIYHNTTSKAQLLINLLDIRGKEDIDKLMRQEILAFKKVGSEELKDEFLKDVSTKYGDVFTF